MNPVNGNVLNSGLAYNYISYSIGYKEIRKPNLFYLPNSSFPFPSPVIYFSPISGTVFREAEGNIEGEVNTKH